MTSNGNDMAREGCSKTVQSPGCTRDRGRATFVRELVSSAYRRFRRPLDSGKATIALAAAAELRHGAGDGDLEGWGLDIAGGGWETSRCRAASPAPGDGRVSKPERLLSPLKPLYAPPGPALPPL